MAKQQNCNQCNNCNLHQQRMLQEANSKDEWEIMVKLFKYWMKEAMYAMGRWRETWEIRQYEREWLEVEKCLRKFELLLLLLLVVVGSVV
jgi:hypothetical protein